MPGAGSGGGLLSHGWGAPALPTHALFPSLHHGAGPEHHSQGGRCQMGRSASQSPRWPPPGQTWRRKTPGCCSLLPGAPGVTGQERGRSPGCMSGLWALQAQPGRSWKEAGQLVLAGLPPGAPEGDQQVRSPVGWGPLMGFAVFPGPGSAQPGRAPAHAESRHRQTPGAPQGLPHLEAPVPLSHGRCPRPGSWSPLPPPPRPAGRAGSELPACLSAVPVRRRAGTQGLPVHLLSPEESSHPCSAPRAEPGAEHPPEVRG